jgi:hypothetical protein
MSNHAIRTHKKGNHYLILNVSTTWWTPKKNLELIIESHI